MMMLHPRSTFNLYEREACTQQSNDSGFNEVGGGGSGILIFFNHDVTLECQGYEGLTFVTSTYPLSLSLF